MEDSFDADKFISLVKSKESIWNYKSKVYGNKQQRKEDWIEICKAMIPDFAEKTGVEKSAIAIEYQAKWKVLRDGFTRSVKNYMKKETSNNKFKGKLYTYYDQLQFLNDLYADQGKMINNIAIAAKCGNQEKGRKRGRQSDASEEIPIEAPLPGKIRHKVVPDGSTQEEDRQFLMSLLSDFRKIPEDRKLDAKGDIINVIRHYRNTPSALLEMRGSYYSSDITALATTATERPGSGCSNFNAAEESSRDSQSPLEIKFTT